MVPAISGKDGCTQINLQAAKAMASQGYDSGKSRPLFLYPAAYAITQQKGYFN